MPHISEIELRSLRVHLYHAESRESLREIPAHHITLDSPILRQAVYEAQFKNPSFCCIKSCYWPTYRAWEFFPHCSYHYKKHREEQQEP